MRLQKYLADAGIASRRKCEEIISAVVNAGYGATEKNAKSKKKSAQDEKKENETKKMLKRFLSSLFFLLILMYISMGHAMWGWPLPSFLQ